MSIKVKLRSNSHWPEIIQYLFCYVGVIVIAGAILEDDLIVYIKYGLTYTFEFCLRGHGLFCNSAVARTILFSTGTGCQALVNGFCSGLQWTGPPSQSPFCPAETVDPVLPPT